MKSDLIIGVDFDNTIVNYDEVFYQTALKKGLIESGCLRKKTDVRDFIRQLPAGEQKWRELQSFVYGKAMDQAHLIDGVQEVFQICREKGIQVYIVSHKSKHATADTEGINLQEVARSWMRNNKFFDDDGLDLQEGQVFFESTRNLKVKRIASLGCTHFIDDLTETFGESNFPPATIKLLFSAQQEKVFPEDLIRFDSWKGINNYLFSKFSLKI